MKFTIIHAGRFLSDGKVHPSPVAFATLAEALEVAEDFGTCTIVELVPAVRVTRTTTTTLDPCC